MTLSYDLEFRGGNGEFGVLRLEGVGGEEDPWLLLLMGPVALTLKPFHIASGATSLQAQGPVVEPGAVTFHPAPRALHLLNPHKLLANSSFIEDECVSTTKCLELT